MLKEYRIGNFKAFSDSQTIPIKPITLIFGKNSSGKSSIIQSLLMLKQTVEEADTNPYIALVPEGRYTKLGSYNNFIFQHDTEKCLSVMMKFDAPIKVRDVFDEQTVKHDLKEDNVKTLENLLNELSSAGLEVRFSIISEKIVVENISLYISDESEPIAIYSRPKSKEGSTSEDVNNLDFEGNFKHPFWKKYWEKVHKEEDGFVERVTGKTRKEAFDEYATQKIAKEKWEKLEKYGKFNFKNITELHKHIYSLSGFEQALECYKEIVFINDKINIKNFIPKYKPFTIHTMEDKIFSLIVYSVSKLVEKYLSNILYVAFLRGYSPMIYKYDGNDPKNVGIKGEMTPHLLYRNSKLLDEINDILHKIGINYNFQISRLTTEDRKESNAFLLQLYDKSMGIYLDGLNDVGFGVSQVLPLIVQSMFSYKKNILVEQPELHLHPAAQAELGDMFIKSALGNNQNKFIIETHSEHLILRLLRRIRETTDDELPDESLALSSDQVSVLYVQSDKNGSKITHLNIDEEGEFEESWPEGFFDERAKELF